MTKAAAASPTAPEAVAPAAEGLGALAAMLVALPSAIGFGLVIYAPLGATYAAAGALAGILGTIALGLVAPIFGGAPRLITAPCGPAAALMATLAAGLMAARPGEPERVLLLMAAIAALAGLLQVAFGAAGGGRVIKYIPFPVVAGYLTSVGLLILLGQIPRLFGWPRGTSLLGGLTSPWLWQWPALVVGAVTIGAMLLAARVTRAVPGAIIGLGCGMAAYLVVGLVRPELRTTVGNPLVIGPIGGGAEGAMLATIAARWQAIGSLTMADLSAIVTPAAMLAVLLSIDTLKTCVVLDALTRSRHRSNRELVGQGLANLTSAVSGGIPGAGTMGATLVNMSSGGRTRLSGFLEGVLSLVVFLVLGSLVAWVPVAALAGILCIVAARMIDLDILQLLRRRTTMLDFAVVAAVVVAALLLDLITAAGIGVGFAILLFVRDQLRGSIIRRRSTGDRMFSKKSRLPDEMAILEAKGARTSIYELQGSLFFGTADQLYSELEVDLRRCRYIVLDLRRVNSVDFTATHVLRQIEDQLGDQDGELLFSGLPPQLPTGQDLESYFDQVGLVRPTRAVRVFSELDDALEWTEDRLLADEAWDAKGADHRLTLGEIHLFRELDAGCLEAVQACVSERSWAAGERIVARGEVSDDLYLIRRGSVRIVLPLSNGRQHHLVTFGRGDFFGDMAFLDRAPRSADAIAWTETDAYVLSRARLDEVVASHPELAGRVFERLARALAMRLRQTDVELRALEEA